MENNVSNNVKLNLSELEAEELLCSELLRRKSHALKEAFIAGYSMDSSMVIVGIEVVDRLAGALTDFRRLQNELIGMPPDQPCELEWRQRYGNILESILAQA